MSFRANLIAYLKACVLYVANGCRWEEEMEDFIRWSLQYDLWCKMRFFGDAIEEAENKLQLSAWRGPRSILHLLPPVFGMDEVIQIRQEQGKTEKGVKEMLRTWVNRGHVVRLEDGRFEKTKKRTKRDEQ